MSNNEFRKATFNLPSKDLEALRELANTNNTTVTSILRKAIGTELYLSKLESRGAKVLIERKDGTIQHIIRSFG
jgi:hypothetical protein